jgi:hypothetical protein
VYRFTMVEDDAGKPIRLVVEGESEAGDEGCL